MTENKNVLDDGVEPYYSIHILDDITPKNGAIADADLNENSLIQLMEEVIKEYSNS